MACNNLAVSRAELSADTYAELFGQPDALEHLRAFIEAQTGRTTTVVNQPCYFGHRPPGFDSWWVRCADGLDVVLVKGQMYTQGTNKALVERLSAPIEATAKAIAIRAVTGRTAAAIKSRFLVKSDVTNAHGARVLRVVL